VKKIVVDPPYLDDEEREIMEAFDKAFDEGTLVSELTPERRAEIEEAARNTMAELRKPISVRLPVEDLSRLKARATQLGLPYQTLLVSIVHQYVEGRLVERP
jgi:predicted DNA binding CopG/RHH family protein